LGVKNKKHLEKYEFVNGKDDIPYVMENLFETTDQINSVLKYLCFDKHLKLGSNPMIRTTIFAAVRRSFLRIFFGDAGHGAGQT